jgi:hypothetical protein
VATACSSGGRLPSSATRPSRALRVLRALSVSTLLIFGERA